MFIFISLYVLVATLCYGSRFYRSNPVHQFRSWQHFAHTYKFLAYERSMSTRTVNCMQSVIIHVFVRIDLKIFYNFQAKINIRDKLVTICFHVGIPVGRRHLSETSSVRQCDSRLVYIWCQRYGVDSDTVSSCDIFILLLPQECYQGGKENCTGLLFCLNVRVLYVIIALQSEPCDSLNQMSLYSALGANLVACMDSALWDSLWCGFIWKPYFLRDALVLRVYFNRNSETW